MTCPLGKLGSLMTRTTVTNSLDGRGRLMRRFTIQFKILDDEASNMKMASRRKRKAQKIPAMPNVNGTPNLGKPTSEMPSMRRRSQGLWWLCKLRVMDL